jgi:hypothetical protein
MRSPRTSYSGVWPWGLALVLVLGLTMAACQPAEPVPTPTPTRTPIVPTATPTPPPTPTLPPDLILPPEPTKPEDWPPLPTDLYFLRAGRLWNWMAEGGQLEAFPVAESVQQSDPILTYQMTPDQRYIAYVTAAGELYVFDRAQWQHTFVPTAGRLVQGGAALLTLTPDGRYLAYVAWGVQPGSDHRQTTDADLPPEQALSSPDTFGTILVTDLANVLRPQIEVGVCRGCASLTLAQEEERALLYTDDAGIWVSPLLTPEPRLLSMHPDNAIYAESTRWHPRGWSPDGRWLLVQSRSGGGATFALMDVTTGQITVLPNATCSGACHIGGSWSQRGLWIARTAEAGGCLYLIQPDGGDTSSGGALPIAYQRCQANVGPLAPSAPHALPDGWVAFAHQGPGPAPGLYFLGPDDHLRPIALLPRADGTVLWAADGSAFLYRDADGTPHYLGLTNGAGFWDVSDLLDGAHAFRWGALATPTP